MNRKRWLGAAVGALVAAAAVGGVAYATIPGSDNVYSACMLKGIGTIRLIDKSLPATNLMSRCTDKELEVSWNQAGQPGPQGPQGLKGEPGAPGTNGTNGTNGKDGVSVTTAPAGGNCADGGVQLTAVNGVSYVCNGARGPEGEQGPAGPQGAKGETGDPGPAGPPGGASSMLAAIQLPKEACIPGSLALPCSPTTLFDLPAVGRVEVVCIVDSGHPRLLWRVANTTSGTRSVFGEGGLGGATLFMRVAPGATFNWFGNEGVEAFEVAIFGDATFGVGPSAEVTIYGAPSSDDTKCDIWGIARPS